MLPDDPTHAPSSPVADGGTTHPHGDLLPPPTGRREFVKKSLAVLTGGAVVLVPVAAGVMVATDPLRRQGEGAGDFLEITRLDALPADGSVRKFQVIADRRDAWNEYKNVPIGAVYLKRVGPDKDQVKAFNVVCPHAGCFVDVAPDGQSFLCPCHNSLFDADGQIVPGRNVSPRGMDELAVNADARRQGVVKVKFQNFRSGMHDKVPQA